MVTVERRVREKRELPSLLAQETAGFRGMMGMQSFIYPQVATLATRQQMSRVRAQGFTVAHMGDGEDDPPPCPDSGGVVDLDAAPGTRVGTVQAAEDARGGATGALTAVFSTLETNEAGDLLPLTGIALAVKGHGDLLGGCHEPVRE
jgi:hypothetical protein